MNINILVNKYKETISKIAFAYKTNHTEDLIQEGFIALIRCCDKYNPKLHTKFNTFAIYCIKNAMRNYISNKIPFIKRKTYISLCKKYDNVGVVNFNKLLPIPSKDDNTDFKIDFNYYLDKLNKSNNIRYIDKCMFKDYYIDGLKQNKQIIGKYNRTKSYVKYSINRTLNILRG